MKKLLFVLEILFLLSPVALAQGIDIGSNKEDASRPVDLILNISIDGIQHSAPAGLNVQMYDESGNASFSTGSQQTDSGGRVAFHTTPGTRQFRISGPGIEEYSGSVQVMRQESRHVESVIVRSKPSGAQAGASPGSSDSISASHLKAPGKAVSEFQAGSKALSSKDYPEAQKRFERAISIYGDYDVAYNGLGVAQMASGNASGARTSFEKAIKLDEHFSEAYRNLARIALADHKYDEVDDLLTRSLQSEPLNAWALTYAAYAELQTHKFDAAIVHAQSAHAIAHPGLASVHIVAAHAYEAAQKPAEALKEYRVYLEEDPTGRDAARAKEAIASASPSVPK